MNVKKFYTKNNEKKIYNNITSHKIYIQQSLESNAASIELTTDNNL